MKNKKTLNLLNFIFLSGLLCFLYLSVNAQTIKLYPSSLRITKGKSNTATALYYVGGSTPDPNIPLLFSSSVPNVATATPSVQGGNLAENLTRINALNAGTAIVTASYNGFTSNPLTVIIDDPAASPIAVIHGDNDASGGTTITTKVGEPIEIDAEQSQGVNSLEWDWGDGDKTADLFSSTHAYLQAGTYTLRLTVKNTAGASATSTVSVTVQNFAVPTNIFTVTNAQQLIDAYNQCTGGEHIVIPAGTTIVGSIILPSRNFSDYVTIRSSGTMPDIRNRISPNDGNLAIIKAQDIGPALSINNSSSKIRFSGIKFEAWNPTNNASQYNIVVIGTLNQTSVSQNPQKIIFQHIVINPPDNVPVRHGIGNQGYKISIISSWIGNIYARCFTGGQGCETDSNAIYSITGRGAHVYNNSFIEGSTENVIYGGDDVSIEGLTPTNVEFRRSHFYKREAWKPSLPGVFSPYGVKNIFEFKTGRRVYFEGSVFENFWFAPQDYGQRSAIAINSFAGINDPWTVTEDIIFENSKIVNVSAVSAVASGVGNDYYARKVNNVIFRNVLIDKINDYYPASSLGRQFNLANGGEDITFDRVTHVDSAQNATYGIWFERENNFRYKIVNSIIGLGSSYQIFSSAGGGNCALNYGTGGVNTTPPCNQDGSWNVAGNIFVRYNADPLPNYPAGNCYATGYSSVGFVDLANGDYRLTGSGACYQGQTNIGADIPSLNQRTACTVSGIGTNCSSAQTPYPGPNTPSIPITLEVENFDKGGEGISYHENFGNTGSGTYRPGETVDIQYRPSEASNNYAVTEAAAGEWLEYTITVPFTRKYDIGVRYASEFNNGTFHIEDCGNDPNNQNCLGINLTGTMTANSTGYWGNFRTITTRSVQLAAGIHVLRLKMDTNSPDGCGCIVANFDAILFKPILFDYDNDGKSDVSVFRPANGNWYLNRSKDGFTVVNLGLSSDIIAPADFDGDGKTDIAVWGTLTGNWYILKSSNSQTTGTQFGESGDIPVQADYDNDGKADIAVWRPSTGTWYIHNINNTTYTIIQFGQNLDKPAVGDYDGDGKSDLAVYRPSTGVWHILKSSNSNYSTTQFGVSTDKIAPADYDGDGKTDIAVYRPSTGTWYIAKSSGGFTSIQFGLNDDIPVPGDYDGDGKVDVAVFRPSNGTWYLQRSLLGFTSIGFGQNGDVPTQSTYVR